MKKLMISLSVLLLCLSCQKAQVQAEDDPGIALPNATEGYLVGIGFYGGTHPNGDATLTYEGVTTSSTLTVPVGSKKQVTVRAIPKPGYKIDYWWKYNAQPPLHSYDPVPFRQKVNERQVSFNTLISSETWFEPVFKARTIYTGLSTFTNGGGSVDVYADTLYVDEPFILGVTPYNGYEFDHWSLNGVITSFDYSITVTPDGSPLNYLAVFKPREQVGGVSVVTVYHLATDVDSYCEVQYTAPNGSEISERFGARIGNFFPVQSGSRMTINVAFAGRGNTVFCTFTHPDGTVQDMSEDRDEVFSVVYLEDIRQNIEVAVEAGTKDHRGDMN